MALGWRQDGKEVRNRCKTPGWRSLRAPAETLRLGLWLLVPVREAHGDGLGLEAGLMAHGEGGAVVSGKGGGGWGTGSWVVD